MWNVTISMTYFCNNDLMHPLRQRLGGGADTKRLGSNELAVDDAARDDYCRDDVRRRFFCKRSVKFVDLLTKTILHWMRRLRRIRSKAHKFSTHSNRYAYLGDRRPEGPGDGGPFFRSPFRMNKGESVSSAVKETFN